MNINVATDGLAKTTRGAIRGRAAGRKARRGNPRPRSQERHGRRRPSRRSKRRWSSTRSIVLRDQHLDTRQHVEISRLFGELEVHPMRPQGEFPEILVLDNHKDNPVLSTDVWHSDTTFRQNPTRYTILRCQIMPKVGGDTLWADMEAAYRGLERALPDHDRRAARRARLPEFPRAVQEDRRGPGQAPQDGGAVPQSLASGGAHASGDRPQVDLRQSAVHGADRRPRAGRKPRDPAGAVRAGAGAGVSVPPALDAEGAIVFWDNRSTQHYAANDYYPERRRMERTAVVGDVPV